MIQEFAMAVGGHVLSGETDNLRTIDCPKGAVTVTHSGKWYLHVSPGPSYLLGFSEDGVADLIRAYEAIHG